MMIVFNEAGLRDVKPPCVAQTFINHNAVLYKVFVIGQQHYIVERPSIKNFSAGGTSVFNPFSAGTVFIRQNLTSVDGPDRLYTPDSDVCRRQILRCKDTPRTEKIKIFVMTVDL